MRICAFMKNENTFFHHWLFDSFDFVHNVVSTNMIINGFFTVPAASVRKWKSCSSLLFLNFQLSRRWQGENVLDERPNAPVLCLFCANFSRPEISTSANIKEKEVVGYSPRWRELRRCRETPLHAEQLIWRQRGGGGRRVRDVLKERAHLVSAGRGFRRSGSPETTAPGTWPLRHPSRSNCMCVCVCVCSHVIFGKIKTIVEGICAFKCVLQSWKFCC